MRSASYNFALNSSSSAEFNIDTRIRTPGQNSSPYAVRYVLEEQVKRPVDVRARSTPRITPLLREFQLAAHARRSVHVAVAYTPPTFHGRIFSLAHFPRRVCRTFTSPSPAPLSLPPTDSARCKLRRRSILRAPLSAPTSSVCGADACVIRVLGAPTRYPNVCNLGEEAERGQILREKSIHFFTYTLLYFK